MREKLHVNRVNKKQLLSLPEREWSDTSKKYKSILILKNGTKHDSGWGQMMLVGCSDGGEPIEVITRCPDDLLWDTSQCQDQYNFRCDCSYSNGGLHFWNSYNLVYQVGLCTSSTTIKLVKED